jgi:hypothetical protein
MAGMYPDDQILSIFGREVRWPGMGADGKFTNGSFSDPLEGGSFVPAATVNLILDNITAVLEAHGMTPNSFGTDQLVKAVSKAAAAPGGPFLIAGNKRELTIKAGTKFNIGSGANVRTFYTDVDMVLNIASILDTGSLANGKDYYVFGCPDAGNGVIFKASLTKTNPQGFAAADVGLCGGFHTLCANVGTGLAYVEGGETKNHPLNGYIGGDILPQSVWCLNHRPHSEPAGMVYIPSLDFWCDIYLQSGSGANTKSAYQGAITRSRQYVDFVEDQFCVKKELLDDGEFAAAMLGSNEQTSVQGASETGATSGGAGGRQDTANRRMISIYGVEEGCGVLWQWLRTTSAGGLQGTIVGQLDTTPTYGDIVMSRAGGAGPYGQAGGKGSFWGLAGALLAGGDWNDSASCGSRARNAYSARSCAYSNVGGRGRSRPMRYIAY